MQLHESCTELMKELRHSEPTTNRGKCTGGGLLGATALVYTERALYRLEGKCVCMRASVLCTACVYVKLVSGLIKGVTTLSDYTPQDQQNVPILWSLVLTSYEVQ